LNQLYKKLGKKHRTDGTDVAKAGKREGKNGLEEFIVEGGQCTGPALAILFPGFGGGRAGISFRTSVSDKIIKTHL
jgi:hypothetical protein